MMSSISRVVRVIRCWWPSGRGGAPGIVTSIRSATSLASSSAASRRSADCSISASSSLRALLAAPPTGPRSSGGSCDDPAQDLGQLGFAAEVFDPQLLQRGARARQRRSPPSPSTRIFSICSSMAAPRHAGDDIRAPPARRAARTRSPRRRRRSVTRRRPAGGSSRSRHRRRGPRSGSPSRSAPRQRVAAPASASSPSPPWATRATRGPGVSSTPATVSRRPGEDRAHARPGRLRSRTGSAQPGPRATVASSRAWAVRMIAPTLPGSPTPSR